MTNRHFFVSASNPGSPDFPAALRCVAERILSEGGNIVFGVHPDAVPSVVEALNALGITEAGRVRAHYIDVFEPRLDPSLGAHPAVELVRYSTDAGSAADLEERHFAGYRVVMIQEACDGFAVVGGKPVSPNTKPAGCVCEFEEYGRQHPLRPRYAHGGFGVADDLGQKNGVYTDLDSFVAAASI